MSVFDELRESVAIGYISDRHFSTKTIDELFDAFEAAHPRCDGCRHWGGWPGGGAIGACRVSGSFRAPGGLFTEGGFWCCHWTKS